MRDFIGIFGWNDTLMPMPAYVLGTVLLAGVGVFALKVGTLRERVTLISLAFAAIGLDLVLAVFVEAQIGFGMQARYIMPLAVGLPLLAGDILQMHAERLRPKGARRFLAAAYGGAAVLHLTAFVANQHRYAIGSSGSWLPPWDSKWSPEGGLGIWFAVAGAGFIVMATAVFVSRPHVSPQTVDDAALFS